VHNSTAWKLAKKPREISTKIEITHPARTSKGLSGTIGEYPVKYRIAWMPRGTKPIENNSAVHARSTRNRKK